MAARSPTTKARNATLQPVGVENLDEALRAVLAPHGVASASRPTVAAFREYVRAAAVAWDAVYDPGIGFASCAFALRLPGGSAVLILAAANASSYSSSLGELLVRLQAANLAFCQSVIEPEAVEKRIALECAGFQRVTQLLYLERDPTFPWVPPPPESLVWIPYSVAAHPRFRAVLEKSYLQSLDCPELTGLRSIDDAIASHRAGGVSGAQMWELLEIDQMDVGVLLMTGIAASRAVEISYMGVVPEQRRRGVGEWLLRRGLDRARTRGARVATIVVDERNLPARRLYDRLGFRVAALRDAYLLISPVDALPARDPCG